MSRRPFPICLAAVLAMLPWSLDANGTYPSASWEVRCNTVKCVAFNGGLLLSPDESGKLVLTTTDGRPARISLIDSPGTRDLPFVLNRPIEAAKMVELLGPNPKLMVERPDRQTEFLSFDLFEQIARALLANYPGAYEGRDEDAPHYRRLDPTAQADPWQMVPHTKPQIQFAIRSQNGTPGAHPGSN